jgi:oligoendopeptidase F
MSDETLRWRLDDIFTRLHGDDYQAAKAAFADQITALEARLDAWEIGGGAPLVASPEATERLRALLTDQDAIARTSGDLYVFLTGHVAVDAFDDAAQSELASLRSLGTRATTIGARIAAWIGRWGEGALADADLGDHRHAVLRTRRAALHLLDDAQEGLAAALSASGGDGWARLHRDLVSRVSVPFAVGDAAPEATGLAGLRVAQSHADRSVRERAYRAERSLFDTHAIAFAAAMNGVKGEVETLARRRGWPTPLDEALFDQGIDAAALAALQSAVREAQPLLRRYLRAKARFLGLEQLAWFDLFAPVAIGAPRSFTWAEASHFVIEHFGRFAPDLEALARRAFTERWIDVLPRPGKRNGAFCMGAPGAQVSRVMLNFGGGLDDVFTLAHELGHAYHNDALYAAGRTPLQARTPMTLAETASIFCETLIGEALLASGDDATRLALLEQDLRSAAQLLIDIDARFRFEQEVFERRRERDVTIAELDDAMLRAQAATYGDALAAEGHPRMWAQKPHYYSVQRSYYNFPYTFGYLFGVGVYAQAKAEPSTFPARYRALLSRTGMADVAALAGEFGIDVADVEFWRTSLAPLSARVAEFEALVARTAATQGRQ